MSASFGGPVIFLINRFIIISYLVKSNVVSQTTADYLIVFASIGATTLLWVIVALLTKPDAEEKLIEFYKKARPMGWWGPIAAKASADLPRGVSPIFKRLVIAFLGLIMIASGILSFHCMYIGKWSMTAVLAIIAVFTGLLFRIMYSSYMGQLHES